MTPSELPSPRLQIEWERGEDEEDTGMPVWLAWYELIMPTVPGDCRTSCKARPRMDTAVTWHDGANIHVRMGFTRCTGGLPPVNSRGEVDTPFRDGVHIQWDAERLKLPAFAVWGDRASDVIAEMASERSARILRTVEKVLGVDRTSEPASPCPRCSVPVESGTEHRPMSRSPGVCAVVDVPTPPPATKKTKP